jgi:hypothetical protein
VQFAAHFEQAALVRRTRSRDLEIPVNPGRPTKTEPFPCTVLAASAAGEDSSRAKQLPAVSASGYGGYFSATAKSLRITSFVAVNKSLFSGSPLEDAALFGTALFLLMLPRPSGNRSKPTNL